MSQTTTFANCDVAERFANCDHIPFKNADLEQWVTERVAKKLTTSVITSPAFMTTPIPPRYHKLVEWMSDMIIGSRHYSSGLHALMEIIDMSMTLWEMLRFSVHYKEREGWLTNWFEQNMLARQILEIRKGDVTKDVDSWVHAQLLLDTMARNPVYGIPRVPIA